MPHAPSTWRDIKSVGSLGLSGVPGANQRKARVSRVGPMGADRLEGPLNFKSRISTAGGWGVFSGHSESSASDQR